MKLNVGVVGLGPKWNSWHRPAFGALADRFSIRAICDPVAHRATTAAAEVGARAVDGFRAIAAADDVEAVLLFSAKWYGALPILAACDHGKAVYSGASVEMPESEATRLHERVTESGVAFMAELPLRMAPATIRLKELIATRLGEPRLLFCNERNIVPQAASCNQPERPASHSRRLLELVDWCRYVAGSRPAGVQCTQHREGEREDYSLLSVDFETRGGPPVVAQIACGDYVQARWSEATSFRRPSDLQVVCERGIAFVDLPGSVTWFDDAGQHTEHVSDDRPLAESLLMQFHRSVSSLVLRSAGLDDAFLALRTVLAAEQAAQGGARVALSSAVAVG